VPPEGSFEIAPQEVQALQASGELLSFIDVRDPEEWEKTRIEGATLIPMGVVPAAIEAIEARADEASLIVYCHHGVRSLQVVSWLRQQGIACSYSLAGGIDRWSREIDSSVARY
jgi:rhodanese-related sulfurtransferase